MACAAVLAAAAPTTRWRRHGEAWTATTSPGCRSASRRQTVRGRPMTPGRGGRLRPRGGEPEDGRAADEPRRRRAAGDALPRRDRWCRASGQGMGQVPGGARPNRAAAGSASRARRRRRRTGRPRPLRRPARGRRAGGRRAAGPRGGRPPRRRRSIGRAPRARRGCSDDDAARSPAQPAGARRSGVPDPDRPASYLLARRCASTGTSPALVDGYFGPADRSRTQVRPSASRLPPRRRLAGRRRGARASRLAADVDEPDRRRWLAAQLVGPRGAGAGAPRRRAALPRPRDGLLRLPAGAHARDRLRGRRRRARRAPAGAGPAARPDGRLGRALHDPDRSPADGRRRAPARVPCARRSRSSACRRASELDRLARPRPAVERLQLVRRTVAAAGSSSTRTCRSAPPTCCPCCPTRPTRATTWSTPGTRRTSWTSSAGWRPASSCINTPECLLSEGLADLGTAVRRPGRRGGRPAGRGLPAGRAGGSGPGECRGGPRGRRVARSASRGRSPPCAAWQATPP